MPYLEIQKSSVGEELACSPVEMPNVTNMTVNEAKKTLEDLELEVQINGEGELVTEQLPKKGIQINAGTKVTIYTE